MSQYHRAGCNTIQTGREDDCDCPVSDNPDHEQAERFDWKHEAEQGRPVSPQAYLALAAQLAEREREIEVLRRVAHQIVGYSRTVQGEQPTVQEIAKNATRAIDFRLLATRSDSDAARGAER